jgi:hypothetical protein
LSSVALACVSACCAEGRVSSWSWRMRASAWATAPCACTTLALSSRDSSAISGWPLTTFSP